MDQKLQKSDHEWDKAYTSSRTAGDHHLMITGVFKVHYGNSSSTIEMPMTVRKDKTDLAEAIKEAEADLCDPQSHSYSTARFTDFV